MTRMSCSVSGSWRRSARPRPRPSPARPGCAARRRSRRPWVWCTRRRMPAVSTNRHGRPPSWTSSSTGSRVVPATASTTTRSPPANLFSRLDLPTFGRPTQCHPAQVRRAGPRPPACTGSAASTASSRSPLPRPCSAETGNGSPRPRIHSAAASASPRSSSTLLAASTTGLPERRSSRTTASSVAVAPTVRVDDEQHGVGQARPRPRPARRPGRPARAGRAPSRRCRPR